MNLMYMDADEILTRFLSGAKTFPDEANFLCAEAGLSALAPAARIISRRHNPDGQAGYAVSQTIVYSNVCQPQCPFCVGTVTKDHPEAFTKTAEQVVAEAGAAVGTGAAQIVLQGGHRIDLPWSYYVGLVRALKEHFPNTQVLAYSPTEIMVFNVVYQKRTREVIGELKAAGMGGLLAAGDESLSTRAPEHRALLRGPWNEWFDVVHRCADAGLPVVAPFVVGLGETVRERVGHLYRVKAVQERTTQAGKPAFRALTVMTLTPPAGWTAPAPGATGSSTPVFTPVSETEYLRMVALARILVQGVPHVVAGVPAALDAGADDLGAPTGVPAHELEARIQATGRTPVRRMGW